MTNTKSYPLLKFQCYVCKEEFKSQELQRLHLLFDHYIYMQDCSTGIAYKQYMTRLQTQRTRREIKQREINQRYHVFKSGRFGRWFQFIEDNRPIRFKCPRCYHLDTCFIYLGMSINGIIIPQVNCGFPACGYQEKATEFQMSIIPSFKELHDEIYESATFPKHLVGTVVNPINEFNHGKLVFNKKRQRYVLH